MGARSSKITAQNNRSDGHLIEYFRNTFVRGGGASNANLSEGLIATGGVISDYVDGSTVYRAHIFTSSGTFDVTAPGTFGDTVDYLVVAGGGGAGREYGGGGGGGAVKYLTSQPVASSPGVYTISVGSGAAAGVVGSASSVSNPLITAITSNGGGADAGPGGSGGGAIGTSPLTGGSATGAPGHPGGIDITSPPLGWGNPGGNAQPGASGGVAAGGGGGGAATAGSNAPSISDSGPGGTGARYSITGTTTYYGGGGGGGTGDSPNSVGTGGLGGGGNGASPTTSEAQPGTFATGGGAGGARRDSGPPNTRANGGSGIVVVRYQIAQLTAEQKATGGAISYYDGMTIHTFTSSGTFATLAPWTGETVEYVVIGGGGSGGSGGSDNPGGGGAGAYRTGTTPIGAHPVSRSIQIGAGGVESNGTESYFGTPITAPGGGKGGNNGSTGNPGGSGGGGGYLGFAGGPATGAPFPGTIGATPTAGWGHAGATSNGTAPRYAAGGGGGAGGAGDSTTTTAYGGLGMQLPTTFRDPASSVGHPGPTSPTFTGADTSGKYWFAGGGGGGIDGPNGIPIAAGGGPGGPYAGAGPAGDGAVADQGVGIPAKENSGSGGGGNSQPTASSIAGRGGSGIVLIAYPS